MFLVSMTAATSRLEKTSAGQKLASGIFFKSCTFAHLETPLQVTETHQENVSYVYNFASGCAVGPNNAGGQAINQNSATNQYSADKRLLSDSAFMAKYGYPKSAALDFQNQFTRQQGPMSCISAACSLAVNQLTGKNVSEATFRKAFSNGNADIASGAAGIHAFSYMIDVNSVLSGYVKSSSSYETNLSTVTSGLSIFDRVIVPIRTDSMGNDWHVLIIQPTISIDNTVRVYDPALGTPYNAPLRDIQPYFDNMQCDVPRPPSVILKR